MLSGLDKLKAEVESGQPRAAHDDEKLGKDLWDQADRLRHDIEKALAEFTKRIDATGAGDALIPLPVERRLEFCYGAILCQSGMATASKLVVRGGAGDKTRERWAFVCEHCYLEVGDYSAVRFAHDGEPVVYSEMLAACHVMACASFTNRRAYYKCLACYENRKDVNFSSATALEKHMETHPGYSLVRKAAEAEVVKATKNSIRRYVLEPDPDSQPPPLSEDNADNRHDAEGEVSPVSSPEMIPVRDLVDESGVPPIYLPAVSTIPTRPAAVPVRPPSPAPVRPVPVPTPSPPTVRPAPVRPRSPPIPRPPSAKPPAVPSKAPVGPPPAELPGAREPPSPVEMPASLGGQQHGHFMGPYQLDAPETPARPPTNMPGGFPLSDDPPPRQQSREDLWRPQLSPPFQRQQQPQPQPPPFRSAPPGPPPQGHRASPQLPQQGHPSRTNPQPPQQGHPFRQNPQSPRQRAPSPDFISTFRRSGGAPPPGNRP